MIFVKSRLITGIIKKILKAVFSVVYKIIEMLHLQFTLLVGIIALILLFTGSFAKQPSLSTVFGIFFILSVIYAIYTTVKKIFGKKESGAVKIVDTPNKSAEPDLSVANNQLKETYPKYFSVKQNKDYLMAEYEDRYELLKKTENGLIKVRTDYKKVNL